MRNTGSIDLRGFADEHGIELEVGERPPGQARFFAWFKGSGVALGGGVLGVVGNGATAQQALADYASRIRGTSLLIASGKRRRKLWCPLELTGGR